MKYSLIILVLFVFNSYANDQVKSLVDSLRSQGIDTIGIFSTWCTGDYGVDQPIDTCMNVGINDNDYVQWKNNGKIFMAKMHKCFKYETLKIRKSVMFDFFKLYESTIKKEKIFPDGCELKIENGDTICEGYIISNHICKTIISLYTASDSVKIYIRENDFDKKTSNVFYEHNIKLKSYKWSRLIQNQIEEIERNNKFIRRTSPSSKVKSPHG